MDCLENFSLTFSRNVFPDVFENFGISSGIVLNIYIAQANPWITPSDILLGILPGDFKKSYLTSFENPSGLAPEIL